MMKYHIKTHPWWCYACALTLAALMPVSVVFAQEDEDEEAEEPVIRLMPFEVAAAEDEGYHATTTLAGNRLRTSLDEVGAAISVYTRELMDDIVATDNETLLAYALNAEVGGSRGNFIGATGEGIENQNVSRPNNNTRVRGLSRADNTFNFYLTDVPWDGYNIERVELQRGANSVLFGVGSPAGIINASTIEANLRENRGQLQFRFDQFESYRTHLDYNHVVVEDELGVRLSLLSNRQKFRQRPAFDTDERVFATSTYMPRFLNEGATSTKLKVNFERGQKDANRPRFVTPADLVSPFFTPRGESGFQGEYRHIADWGLAGQPVDQWEDGGNLDGPGAFGVWPINTDFSGGSPGLYYEAGNPNLALATEIHPWTKGSWHVISQPGHPNEGQVIRNDGLHTDTPGFIHFDYEFDRVKRFTIRDTNRAAADGGLPFQGFWRTSTLTDASRFDFFNNLIDGDSKLQEQDWTVYEVDFMQTFFDNRIGYNLSYYSQEHDNLFIPLMGAAFIPQLYVDVSALDITATENNRVPNPNAGRAFIEWESGHVGGSDATNKRISRRAQVFATLDVPDLTDGDSWWSRSLGRHDFVGLYQDRNLERVSRSFTSGGWGRDFLLARNWRGDIDAPRPGARLTEISAITQSGFNPRVRVYLDAEGPNLTNIQAIRNINPPPNMIPLRGFDATPRPGFDEAAAAEPWEGSLRGEVQARNPENYVGWQENVGTFSWVNAADGEAARDYLSTGMNVSTEKIESTAGVWTGRFFDGVLVGVYGVRRDEATETWMRHSFSADGPVFDPSLENRETREKTVTSHNWSAKLNVTNALERTTGIGQRLPFDVHVLYAEGEVEDPDPTRVDSFGRTLENAVGNTRDASLMLVAKDGRWTFRATNYKTEVLETPSSASIAREVWRLQQVLSQGTRRAGHIENDVDDYAAEWLPAREATIAAGYGDGPGAERAYRKEVMAPAFRDFERTLYEEFPLTRTWYVSGSTTE